MKDACRRALAHQMSKAWVLGSGRLEKAVGEQKALDIYKAIDKGRTETWVVTTRPDGATQVQVLDRLGKPRPIDSSKIINPTFNLSGAQP